MIRTGVNLFTPEPSARNGEVTQRIAKGKGIRIERIVSHGQASPDAFWYDQDEAEWITVLTGSARITIAGQADDILLRPGDTLLLPAHCRHRVAWTAPDEPTIWLALFAEDAPELE